MINQKETCPKCGRFMEFNSCRDAHCCLNWRCNHIEKIVHKNDQWLDPIEFSENPWLDRVTRDSINYNREKMNEIIKVLNKLTNPDIK